MSHQPTKFGGHRQCGSEDIMALFLSYDFARPFDKGSSSFMGGSRSRYVIIPPILMTIGTVVVEA